MTNIRTMTFIQLLPQVPPWSLHQEEGLHCGLHPEEGESFLTLSPYSFTPLTSRPFLLLYPPISCHVPSINSLSPPSPITRSARWGGSKPQGSCTSRSGMEERRGLGRSWRTRQSPGRRPTGLPETAGISKQAHSASQLNYSLQWCLF